MSCPKNFMGYSFIIKGRVERGKRPSLSFLRRCHASIISSSSRLNRVAILSLCDQTRSTNCFLCMQRACPRDHKFTELTVQDVHLIPPFALLFGGMSHSILLHGFVVKQACLVLWLSNPLNLQGSPVFFYLQSPSMIHYVNTYFVHSVPIKIIAKFYSN